MAIKTVLAMGIGLGVAFGAASAQDHSAALGGSMGTQSSATPQSESADKASGAHHTPVAKAQRRHSTHRGSGGTHHSATSSGKSGTTATGDMTPSGNANPTNQH